MIQTLPVRVDSVAAQERANRRDSMWAYLAVVGAGLVSGSPGSGRSADSFSLAFALLVCVAAAIVVRPISGVYLTLFFSLLGDQVTMVGYPFNANFSSHESMLFVTDRLTFSPVELLASSSPSASWLVRVAAARRWHLFGRPLLWPMLAFGAFVIGGFVYGVFLSGGDLNVAMWEIRPLLYLVAMYVLASALLTRADALRVARLDGRARDLGAEPVVAPLLLRRFRGRGGRGSKPSPNIRPRSCTGGYSSWPWGCGLSEAARGGRSSYCSLPPG